MVNVGKYAIRGSYGIFSKSSTTDCPPQTSGSIINPDVVTCSAAISACVGDNKKSEGPR